MPSLKKLKHLFKGFTLVELIVVISVLAVLATIAMSQVSNITAWARDSQRMTDMSSMKSSIELYKAKTGKLPIPTNGSGVTYSWGLLWIQGTFGESVTREIKSITPKPTDPINKIEYVYSIANNNREFELGGILEKATWYIPSILNEVFAASQNVAFIEWTYNGISLKVETGSKTYVVAVPSLIGGYIGATMETSGVTIEWLGSLPQWFSWTTTSTAQTGTFTPTIAWSGTKLPDTSTGVEALVQWLQNTYSGSNATSLAQISSLVNPTGSQVTALGQGLIQNSLGGTAITLPTQTTTGTGTEETPLVTPEIDPYASSIVSLLHFDGNLNDERGKVWTQYNSFPSPTSAQAKFGAWSAQTTGITQYIATPSNSDFDFWGGNFTIDLWYRRASGSDIGWLVNRLTGGATENFGLRIHTNNTLLLYFATNEAWAKNVTSPNNVVPADTAWHHMALVRNWGSILGFIDGTLVISRADIWTETILTGTTPISLGAQINGGGENSFIGNIDEARFTKWVARWASNFTPPTAPTTIPTTIWYSATNPGTNCKALYDAGVHTDGIYWIKPDANAAFKAYCDMTADGGGWTLVWKANANSPVDNWAINTSSLINPTINTFAKFSDATINSIKSSTNTNDLGYRLEQTGSTCSPAKKWYISAGCAFSWRSGGIPRDSDCAKWKLTYTAPSFTYDTYSMWCQSANGWSSSVFCLATGAETIALHYHPSYPSSCQHSYVETLVYVK